MSESSGLKTGGIGLIGAATLGVVMLSPAMSLYGGFGPSYLAAGSAAPFAFVLALIATLPTATSYALLARDYPDSGSAASWMSLAAPVWLARWSAWMVFFYYFDNFVIQPVTCGVFLNDVLGAWGLQPSLLIYGLGCLACCAFAARLVYRGISISTQGALAFLSFETLVVTVLCLTVLWAAFTHGFSFSLAQSFSATGSPAGTIGISKALVFGMLAFCGFDVITTLSEETKMPRTLIPRATFLSLIVYGIFVVFGIWALTYSGAASELRAAAEAGGMPISAIGRKFWGSWSVLIPLTAISAALGISIATSVGASRVLYSSARAGLAPRFLEWLHPRHQVPWRSLHFVFSLGFLAAVITGFILGPYQSFVWWATTSTYFGMVTYLLVNFANVALYRKRVFRSACGFFLHGLLPFIAIVADTYILYTSFFVELWHGDWATGKSIVVFDLLFTALALAVALYFTGAKKKALN